MGSVISLNVSEPAVVTEGLGLMSSSKCLMRFTILEKGESSYGIDSNLYK